jgi:Protein of unknown function (DUF2934)
MRRRYAELEFSLAKIENSLANRPTFSNRIVAIKLISTMPARSDMIESKNGQPDEHGVPPPEPIGKATSRTAAAGKKERPPTRRKTVVAPRKRAPKRPVATKTAGPSDEEIRVRAYFISERRHRLALPGDASSDWLEANRQLLSEAGRG